MKNGRRYILESNSGLPLKDCPFCAGLPWPESEWDRTGQRRKVELCIETRVVWSIKETVVYASCHRCGARGPLYPTGKDPFGKIVTEADAIERAVDAWNRRPEPRPDLKEAAQERTE